MAQVVSWRSTVPNQLIAGLNQKECANAIARLNSFWASALQLTGKLTSPSFSGGVLPGGWCSSWLHAGGIAMHSVAANMNTAFFARAMMSLPSGNL
jgi:hypothetical protein